MGAANVPTDPERQVMNIIILDTEGTNKILPKNGNIAETALVYDVGWIVSDKKRARYLTNLVLSILTCFITAR